MKKKHVIISLLALFALAVLTPTACAPVTLSQSSTVLASATLAAERTTTCFEVTNDDYALLKHRLTRGGAVTTVTTRCFGYETSDCSDAAVKLAFCSGEDCKMGKPVWKGEDGTNISASENWGLRFDVAGYMYAQCKVTNAGGGASDSIIVTHTRIQE